MRYRVGPRAVCGVAPGGVLELGDDTRLNVAALLEAGHIAPIPAEPRPKKPVVDRKPEDD